MESILARALETTLKYGLKSFSKDQFKLQGRTVQLSNLANLADFHLLVVPLSLDVEEEDYDDNLTPLIPIIPIEEEESLWI
ncbi:hypothetical protein K1719_045246 [Acacia pycnantha]|nr:hypothetical protein K1719_045246 [Acacia pycnantha]